LPGRKQSIYPGLPSPRTTPLQDSSSILLFFCVQCLRLHSCHQYRRPRAGSGVILFSERDIVARSGSRPLPTVSVCFNTTPRRSLPCWFSLASVLPWPRVTRLFGFCTTHHYHR
jgi:hypothetical protein